MADKNDVMAAVLGAWTGVPSAVEHLRAELEKLSSSVARIEQALPSPMISIDEACRVTGLSRSSIKRALRDRRIPFIRIGRQVRIDARDLRPISANDITAAAAKARGK